MTSMSNTNNWCNIALIHSFLIRCEEHYGLCSGHICLDLKGHFKCECFDGYEIKDHRFCKAKGEEKPLLMFANRHDIRTLDISLKHRHQHYNSLYSELSSTISVDYSLKDNYLIWSDVANEKMFIAPFNTSQTTFNNISKPQVLIDNKSVVDALAIDWVHRLVFWTDTTKDRIEVANVSNPQMRTVLISSGLEEPRGIAINVMESWIVWTDWGSEPKIERSLEDGSERQVIVDKDIIWPNGITIDLITKRIFWLDAKLNSINSIDYDGQNRRLVLHSAQFIRHPFSLDIFEDTVYWTDWELESVLATNKFAQGEFTNVEALVSGVFSVMDIRVVHSYKKPHSENRCWAHRCSHLCLPKGHDLYTCMCPEDMQLKSNTTCEFKVAPPTTTKSSVLIGTAEPTTEQPTTKSLEEIELEKSHNENKIKQYNEKKKNRDRGQSKDDPNADQQSDGKLALLIALILLVISLVIGTLTLFIYRKYQRY